MNDKRRAELKNIVRRIANLSDALECIRDDEQEARERMPAPFRQDDRGDVAYLITVAISDLKLATELLELAKE